jgi:archaellum component FlaG (FlaF/FlaG flagellin family)
MSTDLEETLKDRANAVAAELDADVLLFNSPTDRNAVYKLRQTLREHHVDRIFILY